MLHLQPGHAMCRVLLYVHGLQVWSQSFSELTTFGDPSKSSTAFHDALVNACRVVNEVRSNRVGSRKQNTVAFKTCVRARALTLSELSLTCVNFVGKITDTEVKTVFT